MSTFPENGAAGPQHEDYPDYNALLSCIHEQIGTYVELPSAVRVDLSLQTPYFTVHGVQTEQDIRSLSPEMDTAAATEEAARQRDVALKAALFDSVQLGKEMHDLQIADKRTELEMAGLDEAEITSGLAEFQPQEPTVATWQCARADDELNGQRLIFVKNTLHDSCGNEYASQASIVKGAQPGWELERTSITLLGNVPVKIVNEAVDTEDELVDRVNGVANNEHRHMLLRLVKGLPLGETAQTPKELLNDMLGAYKDAGITRMRMILLAKDVQERNEMVTGLQQMMEYMGDTGQPPVSELQKLKRYLSDLIV